MTILLDEFISPWSECISHFFKPACDFRASYSDGPHRNFLDQSVSISVVQAIAVMTEDPCRTKSYFWHSGVIEKIGDINTGVIYTETATSENIVIEKVMCLVDTQPYGSFIAAMFHKKSFIFFEDKLFFGREVVKNFFSSPKILHFVP